MDHIVTLAAIVGPGLFYFASLRLTIELIESSKTNRGEVD